jgi:hypothetical protein
MRFWITTTKTCTASNSSPSARGTMPSLLERNGFDYDLVGDLKGYVV